MRDGQRGVALEGGSGAGFLDFVVVTDDLPGRADAHCEFFLLERFEKTHVPVPNIQILRHQPVRFAQTDLALQIHFGVFIHIKNDRRFVAADVLAEAGSKFPCPLQCFGSRNLEIDRGFGKG
ncbi:MAG: hypothetical protein DMG40_07815 [Acidobacteria bacterium]|nr:MAG: hypothetical protein DMG40_07815 [Acidobacteriota bacterium]